MANTCEHHRLIVTGCGAAGMTAALSARVYESDILVLERNSVPGKKLPATGNGKCNFTNLNVTIADLNSDSGDPLEIYSRFDCRDTIRFFEYLGIPARIRNDYCYPASGQASSVRDVLYRRMCEQGIPVRFDCRVRDIRRDNGGFILHTPEYDLSCDRLLIAAGGEAGPCYGSDGSLYYMCKKLGHTVVKPIPALAGLVLDFGFSADTAGVRQDARISLTADDDLLYFETGEIIFNKKGISGIPVMNSSRYAGRALDEGMHVSLHLDFFPDTDDAHLRSVIGSAYKRSAAAGKIPDYNDIAGALTGVINEKLIRPVLEFSGVTEASDIKDQDVGHIFDRVCAALKDFELKVTGTNGFDSAQTTAGGIPLYELDPVTLQSLVCPGLFIAGELADVDGRCGGYNLQWAWTSGMIAGACAGGGSFDKDKFFAS